MVRIEKKQLAALRNAPTDVIITSAKDIVKRASAESTIFDNELEEKVPRFDIDGESR